MAGFIFFLVLGDVVPLVALAIDTVMMIPGVFVLQENLTLHYWIGEASYSIGLGTGEAGILKNPQILSALKNTFSLAFVVAVVTCLMGILVGYAIVKRRGTFISKCLDQISFLPYLIPSIARGCSFGDVCCAKGTNSIPAWIILIVGDCLLDQCPTLCCEGWYQCDEADRRGLRKPP